ncbi:hypothetical protein NN3_60250 [Nocardia neocaledoniensis NBRC 108232]|uniref:Secreted protein n=1 Tax=Nocardia neocaledoniensis TaxID=236511 RepID=A0A317NDQ9_9NOCA|nr:hypothetical protein [Nocardia neocaledoniensis]PWV72937.1 hypothetical protein DFR69_108251 [Nocardia neocaledoniensis]GEM35018.1 hypothetical protein NN3_60250 [Nocardia neocaledoniensis NBRC 108232]
MTTNAHAGHHTTAEPAHAAHHGDHAAHQHHAGHTAVATDHGNAHAGHGAHGDAHAGHGAGAPGGLLITQDGYTLDLDTTIAEPGGIDFRFRILGPDGKPVTEFDPIHDRELHLIVARRELTGFWHVHPVREADGTWVIRLDLPEAGAYRVFTDIAPRALGRTITLGADLAIAGQYAPRPVPAVGRLVEVDDYEVTVGGELRAEGDLLTLTVRKDGAPVTDLQPYLAAFGHLVILRAGDLAYVHVHPNGEPGDGITPAGPEITFHTAVPGPGTYRLFLDFKHGDVVRTAAFTVTAGVTTAPENTHHH